MTKKQSAIAASVMEASRGIPAFVFASTAEDMPKTAAELTAALDSSKYARFDCVCGTSVHSRADTEPFCITCGAGENSVKRVNGSEVKPNVTAKSNLVALNCSVCSTSTVIEAAVAKAITSSKKDGSTPIHCSCCGNPLAVVAEAEEPTKINPEANEPSSDLKTPDPAPKITSDLDDINLSEADDKDLELDSLGDLENEEYEESDSPTSVESDPTQMTTPGEPVPPEQFADPQPESEPEDILEVEPFSIEEVVSEADGLGEDSLGLECDSSEEEMLEDDVPVIEDEEVGDPLVDALDMDDTEQALAFVKASGRLVAMKGHVAIASLSAKSKTPNASLVNSPALQAAARASVSAEGLRAGLKSIGFSMIKVPVTSKAVVERRVQEITAKTAASEDQKQKVFAQSFALAATGLNRGQWKGVANPLRAAMETELTRAGVQSPRRVVSAVFESAGVAYAETLLTTSNKLSKMSAAARKDLAEVLNMTATVSPEDEHDDATDSPDATPVESRFAQGGKKNTAALLRPSNKTSAQSVTAASSVLNGSAPLQFSF